MFLQHVIVGGEANLSKLLSIPAKEPKEDSIQSHPATTTLHSLPRQGQPF
jgi:hypothetical protein